jgi:ABC-type cobalamin/Fe3+-siderophores transport system ATPase subunit
MRYSKFILQNYRGISEKVVIDLGEDRKKPICLVGNNESGKTTILKGIEQIGDLCRGNVLENGELVRCRPKRGMEFSGDIILSAEILFDNNDLKINTEDDQFDELKTKIKSIDKKCQISFIYGYDLSALEYSK